MKRLVAVFVGLFAVVAFIVAEVQLSIIWKRRSRVSSSSKDALSRSHTITMTMTMITRTVNSLYTKR